MNRHEIISHFYNKNGLNEEGKNVLDALQFKDYQEALLWIAHEFSRIKLNWIEIGAGSPYPVGLPNVIRQIEIGSKSNLEDVLVLMWNDLTKDEKSLVNLNFKDMFGFPEFVQRHNHTYCKEKYKKWVTLNKNE